MIISLENLKKLEGIKVEAQVVLEKLSKKINSLYLGLLRAQWLKRDMRIDKLYLKREAVRREASQLCLQISGEINQEFSSKDELMQAILRK